MTRHGQMNLRDIVPPVSKFHDRGRFGRLFPSLPPFLPDTAQVRKSLLTLGQLGGIMDAGSDNPDNASGLPAGFTFLGQFLDHDLTFDPTSSLERQNDPESIQNFRTPAFELDSVYGSGPAASPHLYDNSPNGRGIKFLIEKLDPTIADSKDDLPRNSQNTALIGDPRNDENTILSQLHLAFLKFHNAVIDKVIADGISDPSQAFAEAQRLVRWHYQWVVLHDFLPTIVGEEVVQDVLKKGRKFYKWRNEPFIPVEFSVAAYRFGHSQVRPGYSVNSNFGAAMFGTDPTNPGPDPDNLAGGKRAARRFVEWHRFFQIDGNPAPVNISKKIDSRISTALFQLPFSAIAGLSDNPSSLAQRNLLRHLTFSLPSGQAVAKAMSIEPLSIDDLRDLKDLGVGMEQRTPLWFYILKEAELRADGRTLGPVGGRIVAEVFIGLLEGDRLSFLRAEPTWKPTLPANGEENFGIASLLKFAQVA